MNTINEEDKKAEILKEFEQYCNECDYFNHRIWAYEKMKSLMDKAFAYCEAEVERLKKENEELRADDLSSLESGVMLAVVSETWLRTLNEVAALKKQVEEMDEFIVEHLGIHYQGPK